MGRHGDEGMRRERVDPCSAGSLLFPLPLPLLMLSLSLSQINKIFKKTKQNIPSTLIKGHLVEGIQGQEASLHEGRPWVYLIHLYS